MHFATDEFGVVGAAMRALKMMELAMMSRWNRKLAFDGEVWAFGMFIVVEEAFMRELEGEMEGELAEAESAFVWLCG